jgi:hypothetical protein
MKTVVIAVLCLSTCAFAEEATEPRLLHTPRITQAAGQGLTVRLRPEGDWKLEDIALVARPLGGGPWARYPFARTAADEMEATVPGDQVQPPGLEYYIESTGTDGAKRAHFASAEVPHPVNVVGETDAVRQRVRLADYGGQRSVFRLGTGLTAFGRREADGDDSTDRFSDRFWQLEADYLYRPLTTLYQFGFGFGLMRGQWPEADGERVVDGAAPGVNYGHADLEVLLHRFVAAGFRLDLGANAEGFVAGGGGSLRIGRLAGTHLATRYEYIADVGYTLDFRFHWDTVDRFPMALGVEFTDWPHPDSPTASILSYDVAWRATDAWSVAVRAGVANRAASLDTGYMAGLSVNYGF